MVRRSLMVSSLVLQVAALLICSVSFAQVSPKAEVARTISLNLIYNGDFDNGVWYERFRGWSPVVYERSDASHWIELGNLAIPKSAAELQVVALSRALVDGECKTLCSPVAKLVLRKA